MSQPHATTVDGSPTCPDDRHVGYTPLQIGSLPHCYTPRVENALKVCTMNWPSWTESDKQRLRDRAQQQQQQQQQLATDGTSAREAAQEECIYLEPRLIAKHGVSVWGHSVVGWWRWFPEEPDGDQLSGRKRERCSEAEEGPVCEVPTNGTESAAEIEDKLLVLLSAVSAAPPLLSRRPPPDVCRWLLDTLRTAMQNSACRQNLSHHRVAQQGNTRANFLPLPVPAPEQHAALTNGAEDVGRNSKAAHVVFLAKSSDAAAGLPPCSQKGDLFNDAASPPGGGGISLASRIARSDRVALQRLCTKIQSGGPTDHPSTYSASMPTLPRSDARRCGEHDGNSTSKPLWILLAQDVL